MQSLRVLQVLHTFLPDTHGGIETYVQGLAQVQRQESIAVTILAGHEEGPRGPVFTEGEVDGFRVLRLRPPERGLESAIVNPDLEGAFVELLRREGIGLVHLQHWHNLSGNLVTQARAAAVPVVVTIHDYYPICPWFFRMRNSEICSPETPRETCAQCVAQQTDSSPEAIETILDQRDQVFRRELEAAGALLTLSHDQTDYLRQVPNLSGFEFTPVLLARPEITPQGQHEPKAQGPLRILTWGGLVAGKGMHVLLEACETLSESVEVHHYGRVIETGYADRLRHSARHTRLVLHGPYDKTRMSCEFPRYDLAVFPSLFRETHGYVVDEAMLLGLPVVISDRGAAIERIGTRGVTFPPGEAQALASILQGFLDHPETLAVLRAAPLPPGRSMAEHWSELRQVYTRVLA